MKTEAKDAPRGASHVPYISTAYDVSIGGVESCHCHVVFGFGCHQSAVMRCAMLLGDRKSLAANNIPSTMVRQRPSKSERANDRADDELIFRGTVLNEKQGCRE